LAGIKKSPIEPIDHGLGRSRGGFSSKIHLVCDGHGNPLGAVITGGNINDCVMLQATLENVSIPGERRKNKNRPQMLLADKGYDSVKIRTYLRSRGIQTVIPARGLPPGTKRRKKGPKPKLNKEYYKERNIIERLIGWLKNCRRIATRFEKYASSFLAMVKLAFIKLLLKKHFSDIT